jgi:ribosome maturation protein SDO1
MPVGIIQPSNRINLTNVSLVRYKKGKKRFELACYKNKLLEYRSGIETNLDDVLQVPTIFLSVSKGATAPKEDLEKSFGKKASTPEGHDEIIKEILSKGEIQVGAKERGELLERIEKEVLEEVAGRLVDPGSKRVYTTGMISKALDVLSKEGGHAPKQDSLSERLGKVNLGEGGARGGGKWKMNGDVSSTGTGTPATDSEVDGGGGGVKPDKKHKKSDMPMWTGVVTTKSAKSQALDAMRALIAWQPIPVMRARMRLRVTCPTSIAKQTPKSKAVVATEGEGSDAPAEQHGKGTIKGRILGFVEQVESQDTTGEEWEVIGFVEPGAFKGLGEFVAGETKGRGRVEVLDMAVTHEDET